MARTQPLAGAASGAAASRRNKAKETAAATGDVGEHVTSVILREASLLLCVLVIRVLGVEDAKCAEQATAITTAAGAAGRFFRRLLLRSAVSPRGEERHECDAVSDAHRGDSAA